MRFVWSVAAFILSALLIAAGIAQRTLFTGPTHDQIAVEISQDAGYVLIDSEVLRANPGAQKLIVQGEGELFAAYGRNADMEAWLADTEYNHVTLDAEGAPVTTLIEPVLVEEEEEPDGATEEEATEEDAEETEPAGPATRNPAGSDLWMDSFTDSGRLITDTQLPVETSMLIARDGTEAAPSNIVVSWPLDTRTPWVGPLFAAGGVMLLVGVVLYILAIRNQRRGRGPRRKGAPPLPPTEPIDVVELEESDKRALEASKKKLEGSRKGSASRSALRRRFSIPALGMVAVLVAGCSSDVWPEFDTATPEPTETAEFEVPEGQKPPGVAEAQGARILQEAAATLATADEELDIDLAATRVDGMVLEARKADYKLREALSDRTPPATIPTDEIEVLLPQATDQWPRSILALTRSKTDATVPPVILTMTQADPWSNYKITAMAEMQANAEVPNLAPGWLGAAVISDNAAAFLSMSPAELADAVADIVDTGDDSEYTGAVDQSTLDLAQAVRDSRSTIVKALKDAGAAETSKTAFDLSPASYDPFAMTTLDSGAIVSISLLEVQDVLADDEDAVIKVGDNPEAKTLSGKEESATGFTTHYGLQLFFSIPAQGSSEPIVLLAVHQDILSVKEKS